MSRSNPRTRRVALRRVAITVGLLSGLLATRPSAAATGVVALPATAGHGRVTVFYPTDARPAPLRRGPFTVAMAPDGPPARGNGRLVVVSHGSGGSPWVHADLIDALVGAGYVVAAPDHAGDSAGDPGRPGPDSWTIRPHEVSQAIDAVAADPRFASVDVARVGLCGMSAGGHTALSLAGGRWSPARFRAHCDAHLEEDFPACAGLATRLRGNVLDPLREAIVRLVLRWRFDDAVDRVDHDGRIAAIVAAVPAAADFDPASLATPAVPLGIVVAGRDRWLAPRFHGERVLAVCARCERVADVPDGGHGALLSPLPPGMTGTEGDLLNDPPGFDRATATADVDAKVVAFFRRHLGERPAP